MDVVVALGLVSNPPLLIVWLEIGRSLCLDVAIGYGRGSSGQKTI
jgi:hypothetical protein